MMMNLSMLQRFILPGFRTEIRGGSSPLFTFSEHSQDILLKVWCAV